MIKEKKKKTEKLKKKEDKREKEMEKLLGITKEDKIAEKARRKLAAKNPHLRYELGFDDGVIPKEHRKEFKEIYDEVEKEEKKDQKIADLTETLQRLQAEFENYKKRVDKEKQEFIKYAEEKLVVKLLSILDSFELALKNTTDKEKFIKGVEMIFAQFYSVLESEGLKPIEALGKKLDPYKHEVLLKAFSDKEEDTVIEEFQKGYTFNGKIIRHSKVKISQGKKDDNKRNSAKEDTGIREGMPKEK